MAKVCQLTGKKPSSGHNVSHSVRRTKRRFLPNLQWKKVCVNPETNEWMVLRLATSAIRTMSKEPSKHEKAKMARKAEKLAAKKQAA